MPIEYNVFTYLLFSTIACLILNITGNTYIKKIILVIESISFYYLFAGTMIILIIGLLVLCYVMTAFSVRNSKRVFLIINIICIILTIALFKYYIPGVLGSVSIVMPLGLSYYAFKLMSYSIDAYKSGQESSFIDYCLYISFFPEIVSGPISRRTEIVVNSKALDGKDIRVGFAKIVHGLFMKLVIADRLAPYVDSIITSYKHYGGLALCMAAILYGIQLYCDFAGYSYMVIGISRLMGIKVSDNFRLPVFSESIKDFWGRWHISLSCWLRDYIYIPLGGNRKGNLRKYIAIIITFLVSGMWHGNRLVFLIWGLWHALFNILSPKQKVKGLRRFIRILMTNIIVVIGWLTFKLNTIVDIVAYIKRMLTTIRLDYNSLVEAVLPFTNDNTCLGVFATVIIMILLLFALECREYLGKSNNIYVVMSTQLVLIVLFGVISNNSFIYSLF